MPNVPLCGPANTMKKSKSIKLEDKSEIVISALPLGKYAELLNCLEEIPKQLAGLTPDQTKDTSVFITALPKLIANSLPEFVKIFTIATPLTKEKAENLSLDEAVLVLEAVVDVNNYSALLEKAKKVMASQKK